MEKLVYFIESIKLGYTYKRDWCYTVFAILKSDTPYYKDGKFKLGEEWVSIKHDVKKPLFSRLYEITLSPGDMPNIKSKVKTTIGKAFLNSVLLVKPFNDKIEYKGGKIEVSDIVNAYIIPLLKSGEILPQERSVFSTAITYVGSLAKLFVISATDKMLRPPPNIDKYKKEVKANLIKVYGENAFDSYLVVDMYKKKLQEFDKAYLQDDIDRGAVLLSGKILNSSRTQRYLTYGAERGFSTDGKANFIDQPLGKGLSLKDEDLTEYFNSIRIGSYARGSETQIGGVLAAVLGRATGQYKISVDDCKSTEGILLPVSDFNVKGIVGFYYISGKETKHIDTIETAKKLIGKTILQRSPMRCKSKGTDYCKVCSGDNASLQPGYISLMASNLGGALLNNKMKSLHDASIPVYSTDGVDMFT